MLRSYGRLRGCVFSATRQLSKSASPQVRKYANLHVGKPAFMQANLTLSGLHTNERLGESPLCRLQEHCFPLKESPSSRPRVLRYGSDAYTTMDGPMQEGPPDFDHNVFGFTNYNGVLHDHNYNIDPNISLETHALRYDGPPILSHVRYTRSHFFLMRRTSSHALAIAILTIPCRIFN